MTNTQNPTPLTADEVAELKRLRALKAWKSPAYRELDRRAAVFANAAWRQQDVFGHTNDEWSVR